MTTTSTYIENKENYILNGMTEEPLLLTDYSMKQRKSVRGILLNERDQVLLVRHLDALPADPTQPDVVAYWATPGGGMEVGESETEALQRELQEELGLSEVEVGRCVGVREVQLELPGIGSVLSHETYFLCRVKETPVLNYEGLSESERRTLQAIRWWSRQELAETCEILRPAALPELVAHACSEERGVIMSISE